MEVHDGRCGKADSDDVVVQAQVVVGNRTMVVEPRRIGAAVDDWTYSNHALPPPALERRVGFRSVLAQSAHG